MRRKLLRAAAIACVNLAVVLGALYLATWRYRRSLPVRSLSLAEMSRASGIPVEVLRGISFYGPDARHDLGRVTPKPGVIRIGAFGDSFTFGDEVGAADSYPARLQQLFRADGFENVEVINFGANGLGLSETTHLWEEFGRKLDLAFVVLGPMTMFPEREVTFNHFLEFDAGAMHGRYVLEDHALRWLDPIEPRDEYLRFWPRWIYLRYDRRPPAVLQALLPRGKTIRNPFYYRSDGVEDEAAELYPALLRRWTAGGSQVVLTQLDEDNLRYASGLEDQIAIAGLGAPENPFVARRTMGHLGGTGNQQVAEVVHDILLGKNPAQLEVLAVERDAETKTLPPLDTLSSVRIWIADQPAAKWVYVPEAGFTRPEGEFDLHGVRSILFFDDGPFGTGVGLTSVRQFVAGEAIEADCGGARRKLGQVELHGESLAEANAPALRPLLEWRPGLHLESHCKGPILVGGEPLLNEQLEPIRGRLLAARALPSGALDVARLPASGPIYLELAGVRLKVGRFSKRTREIVWNARGLHRHIAGVGRAEIVAR